MDADDTAPPPRSTVAVAGEIDIAAVPELRSRLDAEHAECVALDVAGVTFIDSSGLAGLLDARAAMVADGRRLELINRPQAVVRLLQVTGLSEQFGPA
jgi:anti-sigma B factor antagonist